MNPRQFNDYLIRLATIADTLRGSLKCVANELDVELIKRYGDDINTILFDLSTVKIDCEFIGRMMRIDDYID